MVRYFRAEQTTQEVVPLLWVLSLGSRSSEGLAASSQLRPSMGDLFRAPGVGAAYTIAELVNVFVVCRILVEHWIPRP